MSQLLLPARVPQAGVGLSLATLWKPWQRWPWGWLPPVALMWCKFGSTMHESGPSQAGTGAHGEEPVPAWAAPRQDLPSQCTEFRVIYGSA